MKLVWHLFRCRHKRITWPRTDRHGIYVACLACGARITYNWREMRIERDDGRKPANVIRAETLF